MTRHAGSASATVTALLPLLVPLVGLLWVPPLAAQAPPPSPDTVVQIPPLEVDVLRSRLAGARTPYAVAGLSEDMLRRARSAAFLSDALVALPGLEIQNRHNYAVGERLTVRGFGARAQFGVRGLRVVVDGVPATLPDGQTTLDHLDLASLGRVELLRGPGSSLYGNGAGGVLLIESRVPTVPGSRATLRGSGGSDGLVEGSVQVEHAAEGATTLGSLSRLRYGGFRTDLVDGGHYGEADRWTANLRHVRPLAGGRLSVALAGVDLDAENPGSLPTDSLGDPARPAWSGNVNQRTGKTVRQSQLGASWRGPLGGFEGDLAAWGIGRDVRNPIPGDIIELDRLAWGLRGSVDRDLTPGLRWGAGLDLELQDDDRTERRNAGGVEQELRVDQRETVRALGLHARVAGDLGPLAVHAALRHDRVRFEADDRLVGPGEADESGERTLTGWSPSVGLLAAVSPLVDLFASASTFLETPTTTELVNRPEAAGGFNPELDPTRGRTFEGGVRGRLRAGIGWELVAFHTTLDDELVPFETSGRTFFRNAGRSRHQGFEAALQASLPGGVSGRAAYTHVDARFLTEAGAAEPDDRVPGRAPNRFEALVRLDRGPVFGEVDLSWSDAIPVDDADTVESPAFTLVGVRLGGDDWTLGRARVSPFLAVRNLLDDDYVASVVVNAFGGRYFEPGPGRELRIGLSLTVAR